MGINDDLRRFGGIVRQQQQVEIAGRHLTFSHQTRADPANQSGPIVAAEQDHRELINFSGLDQREGLEQFIQCTEPTWEDDERIRVLDEHRFAHKEIPEIHQRIHVRIGALFKGQLDIASDRMTTAFFRAFVRGLHDPGARARNNREALFGQQFRGLARGIVLRIIRPGARRAEDRYALRDLGERIEAFDEFRRDAHDTPWIGAREATQIRLRRLQQLLVFGQRGPIANRLIDQSRVHPTRRARTARHKSLRCGFATGFAMSFVRARFERVTRFRFGARPRVGRGRLAARRP